MQPHGPRSRLLFLCPASPPPPGGALYDVTLPFFSTLECTLGKEKIRALPQLATRATVVKWLAWLLALDHIQHLRWPRIASVFTPFHYGCHGHRFESTTLYRVTMLTNF
ncbi:hypothetical protein E2C01_057432 [Portunus trituberculatus]|uniref:Uncharacterized protein n=1 Tax=Portunus trituberculatus TaxID=210409 RepID=A0A5B7H3B7_PORTR|nr:hypothetical protein [Portunus trituberculatus]